MEVTDTGPFMCRSTIMDFCRIQNLYRNLFKFVN